MPDDHPPAHDAGTSGTASPPAGGGDGAPAAPTSRGFLRTAVRPRMLALLVLALALALLFAELGSWQLGRARSSDSGPAERGVVALGEVLQPQEQLDGQAVAGPVEVEGTWAAVPPQVVVGRAPDGSPGDGGWVLAAVEVAGADGALLPVALGHLPGGTVPPGAPTGEVTLVGELALSEDPRGVTLGPGQLESASSADLLNLWGGPIYAGYLVPDQPLAGLDALPAPERETAVNAQNVSYAFQWWVFAAFAVLMWLRIVHDVDRRERERAEDEAADAALGPDDPDRPDPDDPDPDPDRPEPDHPGPDDGGRVAASHDDPAAPTGRAVQEAHR